MSGIHVQGSPHARTMLVKTNLDVRTKFGGSKKVPNEGLLRKMYGFKENRLVRSIFSRDKHSSYMGASLYLKPAINLKGEK